VVKSHAKLRNLPATPAISWKCTQNNFNKILQIMKIDDQHYQKKNKTLNLIKRISESEAPTLTASLALKP
jgi:hypothetical protein